MFLPSNLAWCHVIYHPAPGTVTDRATGIFRWELLDPEWFLASVQRWRLVGLMFGLLMWICFLYDTFTCYVTIFWILKFVLMKPYALSDFCFVLTNDDNMLRSCKSDKNALLWKLLRPAWHRYVATKILCTNKTLHNWAHYLTSCTVTALLDKRRLITNSSVMQSDVCIADKEMTSQ